MWGKIRSGPEPELEPEQRTVGRWKMRQLMENVALFGIDAALIGLVIVC
jgi:hypothetical protein